MGRRFPGSNELEDLGIVVVSLDAAVFQNFRGGVDACVEEFLGELRLPVFGRVFRNEDAVTVSLFTEFQPLCDARGDLHLTCFFSVPPWVLNFFVSKRMTIDENRLLDLMERGHLHFQDVIETNTLQTNLRKDWSKFWVQVLVSTTALVFSLTMAVTNPERESVYIPIATGILGYWLPSPEVPRSVTWRVADRRDVQTVDKDLEDPGNEDPGNESESEDPDTRRRQDPEDIPDNPQVRVVVQEEQQPRKRTKRPPPQASTD